jgi:hypothetical protein
LGGGGFFSFWGVGGWYYGERGDDGSGGCSDGSHLWGGKQ